MNETNGTRPTLPTPDSRRPLVPVEVPAWGCTLYVRRLSIRESTELPETALGFTGGLLVKSICYEDGTRVWQDGDLDTVLAYPGDDLKPLVEQAIAVNGVTKATVEDRQGNSDGGPSASSSSASPSASAE